MSYIEIQNVCKTYKDASGGSSAVLDGIDLDIRQGEFLSVFGPNGCGKSTLFNIMADLIEPDEGAITIDGKKSTESRIGYVFQNYSESLYPWLKNVDNIAFSLDNRVGKRQRNRDHVREFVMKMGLDELPLDKYPYECSAGQQQLVALARELIYEPDVLLMDEPFVSLDYDRRLSQQEYLLNSWTKTNTTILFISHEIDEAIYLADRLVMLSQKPARISETFKINLPRPRDVRMLESQKFFELKVPILQSFREIIGR